MKLRQATRLILGLTAAILGPAGLQAQPIYRSVGPDGRVTFSDKPPPAGKAVTPAAPEAPGGGALPYELRQTASRYPVTLYTANHCEPCGSARAYLLRRGIPFSEKTVTTAEDQAALQRLSGDSGLPLLTIGAQQLKGFSDAEWGQYLDAAGYPRSSQLPGGWRPPAATPLVTLQRPAEAAALPEPTASAPARPAAPAPQAPANPAGIRF